jgi:hypothetical protein
MRWVPDLRPSRRAVPALLRMTRVVQHASGLGARTPTFVMARSQQSFLMVRRPQTFVMVEARHGPSRTTQDPQIGIRMISW